MVYDQKNRSSSNSSDSDNVMNQEIDDKFVTYAKRAIVGLATTIALWSSFYIVGTNDEAVITRLGKYVRTESSGLRFKLPWPIDKVQKVAVTEINRLELGFRTTGQNDEGATYEKNPKESIMLTGDENLVQLESVIQWKVSNSRDYLFNADDIELVITQAAHAAHRQIVGDNSIDKVLTDGKSDIQLQTQSKLQEILDSYKIGVKIVNVQLQDVYAPDEVNEAFKDVQKAKENKNQYINDAKGYANGILPNARGEAQQRIEQAKAYKVNKINTAKGDVARFDAILAEYNKAPEVTETRLKIDAATAVYEKAEKIIVKDGSGSNLLKFLDINQKNEKKD